MIFYPYAFHAAASVSVVTEMITNERIKLFICISAIENKESLSLTSTGTGQALGSG